MGNQKFFIFFVLIIVIYCRGYDHKPEKPIQSHLCPISDSEFYRNFIFYQTDQIKKKKSLREKHYPTSNERRIDLFYPYIKNIKGGYIGVGTDQNLTLIAWARSDYAYLMDFDWAVVYINRLHLLFIELSPDFNTFKQFWSLKNRKKTINWIQKQITSKNEQKKYLYAYRITIHSIQDRFKDWEYMSKHFGFRSFHNNKQDYQYIRNMVLKNRIYPVLGDMNGTKTFLQIAKASKRLCIPIRIIYLSNAEEYFRYPETFRNNIKNLFIDKNSLIVRTVSSGALEYGFPDGEKYIEVPFHYNIQKVQNLITWFSLRKLWIYHMLKYRKDIQKGFSILEATPDEVGLIKRKSL